MRQIIHDGPIDSYLRATKKTLDTLKAEILRGDAGAVSLFAAEVVFAALGDLKEKLEALNPPAGPRSE